MTVHHPEAHRTFRSDVLAPGQQYVTAFALQSAFERFHALMGMKDALIALYEEPEKSHEQIAEEVERACRNKQIEGVSAPNRIM